MKSNDNIDPMRIQLPPIHRAIRTVNALNAAYPKIRFALFPLVYSPSSQTTDQSTLCAPNLDEPTIQQLSCQTTTIMSVDAANWSIRRVKQIYFRLPIIDHPASQCGCDFPANYILNSIYRHLCCTSNGCRRNSQIFCTSAFRLRWGKYVSCWFDEVTKRWIPNVPIYSSLP